MSSSTRSGVSLPPLSIDSGGLSDPEKVRDDPRSQRHQTSSDNWSARTDEDFFTADEDDDCIVDDDDDVNFGFVDARVHMVESSQRHAQRLVHHIHESTTTMHEAAKMSIRASRAVMRNIKALKSNPPGSTGFREALIQAHWDMDSALLPLQIARAASHTATTASASLAAIVQDMGQLVKLPRLTHHSL